jgi:DNA invertase Pin-like site-specific DNA recombinase
MPLLDTRAAAHSVTGQLISDIVLQLLSYVAQVEREHIKQRQAEGIASAKARGVRFGRPHIPLPPQFDQVRGAVSAGRMTRAQAARALGVSASTFDRWVRRERLK